MLFRSNYGHTVGHAVEIASAGTLTHGEAIAIGMSVEVRIAARLNLVSAEVVRRQDTVLQRAGLPTMILAGAPSDEVMMEAMRLDKKARRGEMHFTLLRDAGQGVIDQPVPEPVVREVLRACRASS